jgi:rhamnogalacturonyl hydrolase YesR
MDVTYINGENYIIMNDSDIIEIIEKYCGYELSQLVESKIANVNYEKLLVKEKAKTDEESYLASLENIENCLRDIQDVVENMTEHLKESKRINRDKIHERLKEILTLINNEI